jgi:hypothetical protein
VCAVDRIANPYPQADPTLLLYTLLERRLRPNRLPTEVGVILLDAPAAIAIGALIMADRPDDRRLHRRPRRDEPAGPASVRPRRRRRRDRPAGHGPSTRPASRCAPAPCCATAE